MLTLTLKRLNQEDVKISVNSCEICIDGNVFCLQRDENNGGTLLLRTSIFDDNNAYQALTLNCIASNAINIDIRKDRVEE